jgi:outer membrane protein OmpA-like peptidoglycan-associated protein
MDDLLARTTDTLVRTGGMAGDPLGGVYGQVFHAATVLSTLQAEGFHPQGAGDGAETIDGGGPLRALTDAEWDALVPVGNARVEPIVFARGSDALLPQGRTRLEILVRSLRFWPTVYVTIQGNARADGDMDANRALARSRADAVLRQLVAAGVDANRLRANAATPTAVTGEAQTVVFRLGQEPW